MDSSLFILGAACVDKGLRRQFFADVNRARDEYHVGLSQAQLEGLNTITHHDLSPELEKKLKEVEDLIRTMVKCPRPPCPWPPHFSKAYEVENKS